MSREDFSRVSDLGPLPAMLTAEVGSSALSRAFQEQGVNLGVLDNPLQFIPTRDLCGLHEWAVRLAGDTTFGFRLAKAFTIRELGPLGEFVINSDTLQTMIERLVAALPLHLGGGSVALEQMDGTARYIFRSPFGSVLGARYAGARSVFGMIELVRWFVGPNWLPQAIEVEYGPQPANSPLEDHFDLPVHYNRPSYALLFPSDLLATPNPVQKPIEQSMTLLELAAALRMEPPRTITEAVRTVLSLRLLDGADDIDGTARKLGIGPRSLQRALNSEGTSYRDTLVGVRTDRATELLRTSSASISDIARSLGYSSASHFTRAFIKRTGVPPSKLRKVEARA